jgi:predicted PurR-regulated permease PerM
MHVILLIFKIIDKAQMFFYSKFSLMEHRFLQYLLKNQVILALFILALGWLTVQLRDIIASIFISYIMAAALLPLTAYLKKKHFPKLVAVLIVYLGIFFIGALLVFPLVPFFLSQVNSLIIGLPLYLHKTAEMLGLNFNAIQVQDYVTRELSNIGENALFVTKQVFGGLFSILTIFIVSFYLLLNHDTFRRWVARFFHENDREKAYKIFETVDDKLGAWLRGQIILCTVIGVFTFMALTVIGLPNALPLALIAGVLEAFPTIGPILSAVPAVIVAFTISPTMALTVVVVYIVIQLLENNLIVPKIMQHAVGMNPIIVIIALSTGASLMGVVGALLSIPFLSFLISLTSSIRETNIKVPLGEK